MALVLKDRVKEQSTTTGTGSFTLSGAYDGFQTFATAIASGSTVYYCIHNTGTGVSGEWEVGIGTFTSPSTLSRDTILESSNGGTAVTFSAGTKEVFVTYPAEKSIILDASGNSTPLGTVSSGTWQGTAVGIGYGGTGQTTAQAAINSLAGAVTSGQYLRGNGTNVVMSAIQAADVPTLNQNTTGSAGSVVNALTMNNSGTGAASGTTFNGSAAKTISYNSIGASPLAGSSSLTTTGTVTSGTWSASFGAVSGANLTNLTAGNLSGTIPSAVLGNSTLYVGTTVIALNRASANQALTGISSVTLPGSTSGTVQVIPAATAGTGTVFTLPATTGTAITSGDTGTVTNTMLAGSIANAKLANSSVTINGSAVSLGGSITVTATATNALTIGSYLTGTSYNGSAAVTIAADATSANTASKLVARDASGNFSAGTITATLSGNASTATSSPLLSALGLYVWSESTLPQSYNQGIQCSFISSTQGWPQAYGSVMTMNTYSGGGGALQMYVPYSPTYGGTGMQVRFGNYDVSGGNSWTSWKTLLASDNYTSYAPSLTGSGASGTWGINVTGSAGSVANALTVGTALQLNSGTTYNGSAAKTISLANTAVTAGSYTYASITVDAQGRLTAASSGAAPSAFPAGTVMLFAQTAAPTGWTKVTTYNDYALRVVNGTAGAGGSTAFTTAFSSQAVSGSVGAYTLTTTNIPSHTHGNTFQIYWNAGSRFSGGTSWGYDYSHVTAATGGGGSHTHSFTGTAINLAVQYVDVILASKT